MKAKLDRFNDERALAEIDVQSNLNAIRNQVEEITHRLNALQRLVPRLSQAAESVEETARKVQNSMGNGFVLVVPHKEIDPARLYNYDRNRQNEPELVAREVAELVITSVDVRRMDKFRNGPLLGWAEIGMDGFRNNVYTLRQ